MPPLHGHRLLLGISGGIASYKSATLARRLIDAGAEVRVVMTAGAQAFVTPLTLQALTGEPVHTDLLDPAAEAAMGHIELARWANAVLVAPASANTLARLANGFADDLLSTLCLATAAPLYVAPAMNRLMWAHVATRDNVARLERRGVVVLGPAEGLQACGESGAGRMLEPEELCDALVARLARIGSAGTMLPDAALLPGAGTANTANGNRPTSARRSARDAPASTDGSLAGLSIVLSAGPTREAIDPVRYLSNRSSGRMGYALAGAAAAGGARVTLISGPVSLATPPGVTRVDVVSAREMHEAVLAAVVGTRPGAAPETGIAEDRHLALLGGDRPDGSLARGPANPLADVPADTLAGTLSGAPGHAPADVFIGVAAVSDYRVADVAAQKIKKSEEGMTLELTRNPDILADVAALPPAVRPFCVGFAAETERVEAHARDKLARKRLDLIAANHVGQPGREVFGSATNALEVFWPPDGHACIGTAPKEAIAAQLLAIIAERLATTAGETPASDAAADANRPTVAAGTPL